MLLKDALMLKCCWDFQDLLTDEAFIVKIVPEVLLLLAGRTEE